MRESLLVTCLSLLLLVLSDSLPAIANFDEKNISSDQMEIINAIEREVGNIRRNFESTTT
jgi:hypothetical protein